MGQGVSTIIRWIFSWDKSSDHHHQQQQKNPNETLIKPLLTHPQTTNNSSSAPSFQSTINIGFDNNSNTNNATLSRAPSSSSSSSNSFFIGIDQHSIECEAALYDTNLLHPHVDHSSSIVEIRSSSSEEEEEEEFDYSQSIKSVGEYWIDVTEEEFDYSQSIKSDGEYWIDVTEAESLINPVIEEETVVIKWINHYSSEQRILLVGDGDFSFSASLGKAFGSAANIIATSLDSEEFLRSNYRNAMSNIQSLRERGCMVLHGVDATEMENHLSLKGIKFDRVIYNFPLAGFFPREPRHTEILRHRALVSGFLENAKKMISENGEIHITHKSNGFFREWKLEAIAFAHGLRLVQELHFNFTDYKGYHTKYGFGGDNNFNCYPSRTYKFGLASSISR